MASYKKTDKAVALILEALENGSTRRAAAAAGGICRDSLTDWIRADPEFRDKVTLAEGRAEASVAGALYKAALAGDYRAADLWLRRRCPEGWSDVDPLDREIKALQLRAEKVHLAAALFAAKANKIPTEPEAVTT